MTLKIFGFGVKDICVARAAFMKPFLFYQSRNNPVGERNLEHCYRLFLRTGNSLFAAREIARKTDGKLIPIPSVINADLVYPEADFFGVVFPVDYATNDYGIPLIVSRFIRKLKNIESKYIFALYTCGGMPGSTIENLSYLTC